jgi:hypothetical protein
MGELFLHIEQFNPKDICKVFTCGIIFWLTTTVQEIKDIITDWPY